jgi:hypothetical protein
MGADRLHQRPGLGRRIEIVLQREPPSELLVDPQRAGAVAGAIKQPQHAAECVLIVRGELEGVSRPATGLATVSPLLGGFRESPGRCCGQVPQAEAFAVQPVLESGRTGEMETLQQVAAIQLQCPSLFGRVDRFAKRGGIAPELLPRDGQLILAPSRDCIASQAGAQVVQRAAQRSPGMLLVELGPEHRQQGVPAVIPAGRGDREIGQQREALGLLQYGANLVAFPVAQVEDAECPKLDHGPLEIRRTGSEGNVAHVG